MCFLAKLGFLAKLDFLAKLGFLAKLCLLPKLCFLTKMAGLRAQIPLVWFGMVWFDWMSSRKLQVSI